MQINYNFNRFIILGLYVLLSVAANQYVNFVRYHDFLEVLWFCDATAILLGIGLLRKNKTLTTLALVTAVPAQFYWILDFFLELFGVGAGRTAELYTFGPAVFWLSVNLHAIIIPISFYAVWSRGFDRRALKPILLYMGLLLTATFLLTPYAENRNCVFYGCDERDLTDTLVGYGRYFVFHSLLYWEVISAASFFVLRTLFDLRGWATARTNLSFPGLDA